MPAAGCTGRAQACRSLDPRATRPPSRAGRHRRPPGDYPIDFHVERQAEYHRFLPLVKWLLAIPHYIVLVFVGIARFFALIGAFFAVLFTGRWPRGLFDFIAGTLRWGYRVSAYVFLLTDEYPPFSLAEEPDYPVQIRIDYPEHIDNWRPLVHWLLVIPYLFVAGVLGLGGRDRRLHRHLRDPVHEGAAPRGCST